MSSSRVKGGKARWWCVFAVVGFLCCCVVACGGSGNVDASTPIAEASHVGNCVACHVAPSFTDFGMHNTGASQEEYDSMHGDGSFSQLAILRALNEDYN